VDAIDKRDIAGPITPMYRITPITPRIIIIKMTEMIQKPLPDNKGFLPGKSCVSYAPAGTGRTLTGRDCSTRSSEAAGTDRTGATGLFSAGDSTFAGGGEGGVLFPWNCASVRLPRRWSSLDCATVLFGLIRNTRSRQSLCWAASAKTKLIRSQPCSEEGFFIRYFVRTSFA
jgi:hypothetical protein